MCACACVRVCVCALGLGCNVVNMYSLYNLFTITCFNVRAAINYIHQCSIIKHVL